MAVLAAALLVALLLARCAPGKSGSDGAPAGPRGGWLELTLQGITGPVTTPDRLEVRGLDGRVYYRTTTPDMSFHYALWDPGFLPSMQVVAVASGPGGQDRDVVTWTLTPEQFRGTSGNLRVPEDNPDAVRLMIRWKRRGARPPPFSWDSLHEVLAQPEARAHLGETLLRSSNVLLPQEQELRVSYRTWLDPEPLVQVHLDAARPGAGFTGTTVLLSLTRYGGLQPIGFEGEVPNLMIPERPPDLPRPAAPILDVRRMQAGLADWNVRWGLGPTQGAREPILYVSPSAPPVR